MRNDSVISIMDLQFSLSSQSPIFEVSVVLTMVHECVHGYEGVDVNY